jgi:hypothetical protein
MIIERKKYISVNSKGNKDYFDKTVLKCDLCGIDHMRDTKHYNRMKRHHLFDKDYCNKCWRPKIYGTAEYRQKMSKSVKIAYENTELRAQLSKIMKGVNSGDKNAMKRKDVRAKVSETRKKIFADPIKGKILREKISNGMSRAREDGTYFVGPTKGRIKCKWYDYKHSNGEIYKVQGTWELKFIEWLDKNNMKFLCHRHYIKYLTKDNKQRFYYPDFFIFDWNCYVDIKSGFWFEKQLDKFDLIQQQNPDVAIKILMKKELNELGVNV